VLFVVSNGLKVFYEKTLLVGTVTEQLKLDSGNIKVGLFLEEAKTAFWRKNLEGLEKD